MQRRTQIATTLAAGAALAWSAAPAAGQAQTNRLQTPGAETAGLPGWTNSGWSTGARGSADRFPPVTDPLLPTGANAGPNVFAATASGSTLKQTVDVSDIAGTIDGSGPPAVATFGGSFGGSNEDPDTVSLRSSRATRTAALSGPAT